MGGRQERRIGDDVSPHIGQWKRSRSQAVRRREGEMGDKFFGERDRDVRDKLRRERIKQSQIEFEKKVLALEDPQRGSDTNSTVVVLGIPAKQGDSRIKSLGLLGKRSRFQLNRAFGHILRNTATPQEIDYFFRHADELGITAIVGEKTIVDFTDPAKKELPDAA